MGFYWVLWASSAQLHYSSSLRFMGLSSTPYFLCFHYFGFDVAHSYFSTSYIAHGFFFFFLSLFLGSFKPIYPSRPICLFHGPVIHYSCCLGLMGFLSICQLFSVRVAGLLLSTWASKMAINTRLNHLQVFYRFGFPELSYRYIIYFSALFTWYDLLVLT